MKHILSSVLSFFVLTFIVTSIGSAEAIPGKEAPNFSLMGVDGKQYQLSDQKGSLVVLEWTNPECPFVKKHYGAHNMQSLQKKYTAQGVKWFSINSSAPGKQGYLTADDGLELLKEKEASPTALLLDPTGEVGKLFGAKTTPHLFVINKESVVVYAGAIDDNDSSSPAVIPESRNYVAQALDELLAGKAVSVPATRSYGCSVKYASF